MEFDYDRLRNKFKRKAIGYAISHPRQTYIAGKYAIKYKRAENNIKNKYKNLKNNLF